MGEPVADARELRRLLHDAHEQLLERDRLLRTLTGELGKQRRKLAKSEQRLSRIESSWLWRMTSPLRHALRAVRRG